MTGNDFFELIALCEQILDDGEVTVDEVRKLDDWFTEHEDAKRIWPGTVLAAPIDDLMVDDSFSQEELRQLATLLRGVQKDWIERRDEMTHQVAHEMVSVDTASAAARSMDLSQALLPPMPITCTLQSHSNDQVIYTVDLSGPSCTCPDWVGSRSKLPRGSLSRCCKHVFDAYIRLRPTDGWPGWLDAFFEKGWRPYPKKQWVVLRLDSTFALLSFGGNDWCDVFAVEDDTYERFGFNLIERRWSYDNKPGEADRIEGELLKQAASI